MRQPPDKVLVFIFSLTSVDVAVWRTVKNKFSMLKEWTRSLGCTAAGDVKEAIHAPIGSVSSLNLNGIASCFGIIEQEIIEMFNE